MGLVRIFKFLTSPLVHHHQMQIVDWKTLVADKLARREASIPKEWVITPPPDTVLDVSSFPEKCGLLSEDEIEITNTKTEDLLAKLTAGSITAVKVTTAFCKRAIIAHQLVSTN